MRFYSVSVNIRKTFYNYDFYSGIQLVCDYKNYNNSADTFSQLFLIFLMVMMMLLLMSAVKF